MLTQQLRGLWNKETRGAAAVVLAQVGGAGLSLLFSVLLARLIGAAEIGLYFIALTVIEIGATLARLGMDHAVLRFVSIARSQADRGSMAAIYRLSLGVSFAMAIAVAFPVWLMFSQLALGGERARDLQGVLPLRHPPLHQHPNRCRKPRPPSNAN